MRYVAGQPAERILPPGSFASIGQALPAGEPLSNEERIRILVWNIFKQQRAEWLSVLKNYGKDAHLVLLQEAQTTPELVQFATANYLAADQVPAFVLPQHPSGVMTLSAAHPVYCCLYGKENRFYVWRNQPGDGISLAGYPFINGSKCSCGKF